VKDGHLFKLGDRTLEVVEVPGHTPGSIVLLDAAHKIVFTGDNDNQLVWLFLKNCRPLEVYLQSLKKLDARVCEFEQIMPGHGAPLKSGFVAEQIAAVQSILDGTCTAKPYKSFAGESLLCTYKSASIAYDPNNLREKK
jgi:glyoxylase-like metal-dependent hydrolase (beta-lactamase superfamily II)